jgi:hypothetical protein
MKPLSVDFVVRVSKWPWLGYALAVGLLSLAGWGAWSTTALIKQARFSETKVATLQAKVDSPRLKADDTVPPPPATPAYFQDAATIARLAEFDVGKILAAIESAQLAGIKVTAVEIRTAERTARVELEVTDPASLLQYLEQINAGVEATPPWSLQRTKSATDTAPGSATIVAGPEAGMR